MRWPDLDLGGVPGDARCHFLDSGAFSLLPQARAWAKQQRRPLGEFFDTPAAFAYIDEYAAFVKAHALGIDHYANVDVIGDADRTYRNQKYLEDRHGLRPVPVVHYPTPISWLQRYLAEGYDYLALGGLVGTAGGAGFTSWLDRCFTVVCSGRDGMPSMRIHGFGMTNFRLMRRYPWYSVDSASWSKGASYGSILVPPQRRGTFDFVASPLVVAISQDCPKIKDAWGHYATLPAAGRQVVDRWLQHIGVPLGQGNGDTITQYGVLNRHCERKLANLLYFEHFRRTLPVWPWSFRPFRRRTL